mmetsp:Transcript_71487/g.209958  ORF Transcript_71487/g.209958 Transcript_71487/m.209958 type:complete len:262 (-) Transcript_71487:64-849(-)
MCSVFLLLGLDHLLRLGLGGLQELRRDDAVLVVGCRADPGHLKLEFLILLVVNLVQDPCRVHEGLLAGQLLAKAGEELLNLGLGGLRALAAGSPLVLVHQARRLDAEERRLLGLLVDAAQEHCAAEGPDRPVQRVGVDEHAQALSEDLGGHLLVVRALVLLRLRPRPGNKLPRVCEESGHGHARAPVNGEDALHGARHQHLGEQELLHGKDDAVLAADRQCGAAVLDGLPGILHLEDATVRREGGDREVVAGTGARHRCRG